MDVYLDYNAMVDVLRNRNTVLCATVERARQRDLRFVYSPAHIEEVANILRSDANDDDADIHVKAHLAFILELTNGWECLPSVSGSSTRLVQESPYECFKRVVDKYELTYFAETNEADLRLLVPAIRGRPVPINVFDDPTVAEILEQRRLMRGYATIPIPKGDDLRKDHGLLVATIDMLFRSLHDAGYGLESPKKTRSSIHDVTHAVYATQADAFVTHDERLLAKVRAIYRFLNWLKKKAGELER